MKHTILLLAALWLSTPAMSAVVIKPVPASTELKLGEGINDVNIGAMTVRIIKGYMGDLTANSYTTYTVFIVPSKKGEPWQHIWSSDLNGDGLTWRTSEAADANLRAVSFYKQAGQLYAVQAVKVGLPPSEIKMNKASVELRVSKFNQDQDVPMFDFQGTLRSRAKYQDAAEGLAKEYFTGK